MRSPSSSTGADAGGRAPGFALPLRWGLTIIVLALLASYVVIAALALRAAQQVGAAEARAARETWVRHETTAALGSFERARGDLTAALASGITGSSMAEDVRVQANDAHRSIEAVAATPVSPQVDAAVRILHTTLDDGLMAIDQGVGLLSGTSEADAVAPAVLALRRAGSSVQSSYEQAMVPLDATVGQAEAALQEARQQAAVSLVAVSAAMACLVLGIGVIIVRSVRNRLRHIAEMAVRVGEGDLDVRTPVRAHDEIGRIAEALNDAVAVQRDLVHRLEVDAERVRLASGLDQAFDMVDREPEVHALVARALQELLPDRPGAMLLADASRAHLEVVAVNPGAAPPPCPVAFPYDCIAVRRGSMQTFASSADISACPKLAACAGCADPVAATCVPVTFMGRALGVIHVTGPVGQQPDSDRLTLLGQVAALAGSRIGTIRTFERTQIQAETDGLTGLPNRRTFETRARAMLEASGPLALAVLDLDHFKLLNDTYGHEAGDRALRAFAGVVRSRLREQDLVARIGGEEFAVIMPRTTVTTAQEVLDRVRAGLVDTAVGEAPAVTVSGGLVGRTPGDTLDRLLRQADRALYRAKRTGRDRIVVSGSPDDPAVPAGSGSSIGLDGDDPDDVPMSYVIDGGDAGRAPGPADGSVDDERAWPWSADVAGFVSAATADDDLPGGDR